MTLNIFVEPNFKDSIWCRQQIKSITDEAALKRNTVNIIDSTDLADVDFDSLFADSADRRLLICLCASVETVARIGKLLEAGNLHVIFLNYPSPDLIENYSNIIMDYPGAMQKIIGYLASAGRSRIALYGINPDSSTDMIKNDAFIRFMRGIDPAYGESSVYYNFACLKNCFDKFYSEREKYNAVVCANDIVAISLINELKAVGVRVPEDFHIVSFGDTVLSKIYTPSITNVSVDLFELGRQAVHLYSYLNKREPNISVSVKVLSRLIVRDSTANFPLDTDRKAPPAADAGTNGQPNPTRKFDAPSADNLSYYPDMNFYNDPCVIELLRVEDLLCRLNEFDFNLLSSLLNSETMVQIIDKLYTSQQAISYRIKRMCQITGAKDKTELLGLVRPYLSGDVLDLYKKNCIFTDL